MASFLGLPAEIRNQIYRTCTPFTDYVEEFKGLAQVSKQVRVEYESEAVRAIRQFLGRIEKQWPHATAKLRIEHPATLQTLDQLTVRLPRSLYYPPTAQVLSMNAEEVKMFQLENTRMEMCLAPLFSLYLSRLTISYYNDGPTPSPADYRTIPLGLLYDMTGILYGAPPNPSSRLMEENRSKRDFRLTRPLHIRRLVYGWDGKKEVLRPNCWSDYHIDRANIQFFLREEHRWADWNPRTLVTNWGGNGDFVYFELKGPMQVHHGPL